MLSLYRYICEEEEDVELHHISDGVDQEKYTGSAVVLDQLVGADGVGAFGQILSI